MPKIDWKRHFNKLNACTTSGSSVKWRTHWSENCQNWLKNAKLVQRFLSWIWQPFLKPKHNKHFKTSTWRRNLKIFGIYFLKNWGKNVWHGRTRTYGNRYLLSLVHIVETSWLFCHLDFYVKSNQSFKIAKFDFTKNL